MSPASTLNLAPRWFGYRSLTLACALYVAAAFAIGPVDYLTFLGQYCVIMLQAMPTIVLMVVGTLGICQQPFAPVYGMQIVLRRSFIPAMAVLTVFLFAVSAFTAFKFKIPFYVPFYADPYLISIGKFIHGEAPWRIAHRIAPSWAPAAIDMVYTRLWFIEWFGVLAFVAFSHNRQRRLRYLWAFGLTMFLVGTVMATAFSSAGPLFYNQFFPGSPPSELVAILNADPYGAKVIGYAAYLSDSLKTKDAVFGTGISAMPSMHVAIAVLNAWYLGSLSRPLGVAAWLFAAAVMFGSVYTGWHYSADGYVSAIVVSLIWWGTRKIQLSQPIDRAKRTASVLAHDVYVTDPGVRVGRETTASA